MRALLAVLMIATPLHAQEPVARIFPQVQEEWSQLGDVGGWILCAIGFERGDTVYVHEQSMAMAVQRPDGYVAIGCPNESIGTIRPRMTDETPCSLEHEQLASGERVRILWCGSEGLRLKRQGDEKLRKRES